MKPHKSTVLIVLLGLFLAAFAVGLAQTSSQKKHAKHTEESCSMDSCCCKGDSCPIKEGTANADTKADGCCCCDGDSCEMKKEGMNGDAAHEGCCIGDSSAPQMKEAMKEKMKEKMKNHSADGECCCNMKEKHNDSKHKMKQKAA